MCRSKVRGSFHCRHIDSLGEYDMTQILFGTSSSRPNNKAGHPSTRSLQSFWRSAIHREVELVLDGYLRVEARCGSLDFHRSELAVADRRKMYRSF